MRKIEYDIEKTPKQLADAIEKFRTKTARSYPSKPAEVGDIFKEAKEELEIQFKDKCAYCEGNGKFCWNFEVEHYRPKAHNKKRKEKYHKDFEGYYWLSYEWSNLLLACRHCNEKKSDRFPLLNNDETKRKTSLPSDEDGNIILSIKYYQTEEQPLLLHPVLDDIDSHICFSYSGEIKEKNDSEKGKKSIELYNLNRPFLTDARASIITEDFMKSIHRSYMVYSKRYDHNNMTKEAISFLIDKFLLKLREQIHDAELPFIAFRKAILDNFLEFVIENKVILKKGEKEFEILQKELWKECLEEELSKI